MIASTLQAAILLLSFLSLSPSSSTGNLVSAASLGHSNAHSVPRGFHHHRAPKKRIPFGHHSGSHWRDSHGASWSSSSSDDASAYAALTSGFTASSSSSSSSSADDAANTAVTSAYTAITSAYTSTTATSSNYTVTASVSSSTSTPTSTYTYVSTSDDFSLLSAEDVTAVATATTVGAAPNPGGTANTVVSGDDYALVLPASPTDTVGATPALTSATYITAVPTATGSAGSVAIAGSSLVLEEVVANSSAIQALTSDDYRYRAQSGVNLGNWFTAEEYMDTDYFSCAADYLGGGAEINIAMGCSQAWLENHWDTWITESDFAVMASAGINSVRIGVGYWSVGADYCACSEDPFYPYMGKYVNSWERVLRAIGWAQSYGIGVLLDMHGVQGSQNGWEHSGITSDEVLFPYNTTYQANTVEVMKYIASTIADYTNMIGFELVNEPYPSPLAEYTAFYTTVFDALRPILGEDFPFYIYGDSDDWNDWIKAQSGMVVQDYHNYYVFNATEQTLETVISEIEGATTTTLTSWGSGGNLVIGEFTGAVTSYQGDEGTAEQKAYIQAQQALYTSSSIAGNYLWSYRMGTATCNPWSWLDFTGISQNNCDDSNDYPIQPVSGTNFAPPASEAVLSNNSKSSSSRKRMELSKRDHYERQHRDDALAMDSWDRGCDVALRFAAKNGKLGFVAQYMKDKRIEGAEEHFTNGVRACE